MKRAAVYIRYNKPIEDMQLEEILNYAKKKNLYIYQVNKDVCSGLTYNPPGLNNLINASHNFDSLLVYSSSRISRNYKYFQETKTKLLKSNVNIISLKEGAI